jgi:hypothetical protein
MDEFKGIVMVGNMSDGWIPVGPFDTWEDACWWADNNIAETNTWVMSVYSPEKYMEYLEFDAHGN